MASATIHATHPIISQGATVSELAMMFGRDRKDVGIRLQGVPSIGRRGDSDVWRIRDAAPRLMRLDDADADLVERVLRTHHNDLPKMLAKEFWAAMNSRLTFMERSHDLWDTGAVVELASGTFKTIRMALMLIPDAVEREVGLTEGQREIIARLVHTALNEMREKLVDGFERSRENSQGKAFASGQASGGGDI